MNAIGYARCSTQEQADSGLGLDAQRQRIRAYGSLKDLRLIEIITDAGVSGGKPLASRAGGARLLDMLKRRKATSIIMLKLDRGFRNAGDCLTTVEQWDKAKIALHVVDLGGNAIDTTSAAGRFMLVILAGAAEMERNLTRERTKAAMAVKRANGKRIGTIPYGYTLADDGATLLPNDPEQSIVNEISAMRDKGFTLQRIANALTDRNIPTKAGNSTWRHQTIAQILSRQRKNFLAIHNR